MKLWTLLVCLVVCSAALAQWIPAFAPNPSFETDANRDGEPDGWTPALFRSPAVATWDKIVAHSGQCSVRVDNSLHPTDTAWDANAGRWVQAQVRPCKPGDLFTLAVWMKTDLTAGKANAALCFTSAGKWLAEIGTPPVTGKTDWTLYTAKITAPETADGVRVYLMTSGTRGSVWFDDVSVTYGDKPQGNFRPIDIRSACTVGFTDDVEGDGKGGWTDQGSNDARELPLGDQIFRTIPFHIIDPATNGNRSCIVLRGRGRESLPASAEFPVNEKADVLYFLHADAWGGSDENVVARYVITFADGQSVTVPLRNNREIRDWHRPADTTESAVGWQGKNPQAPEIGLMIFPWRNPRPDTAIARVRFEFVGEAVPILVAVTAGDGPPILPELPLKYEFTDTTGWYQWNFALDDPTLKEIDLSFLLDPPAGKHGFLTVHPDGHFYFEDGTRARFFGTNLVGARCAPDKQTAELIAERLSRYGINLVRLHAIDARYANIIDYSKGNTQTLNPEAMDRYDYLVAQLLKRGIYVYFDLLDYRGFLPGDGVRDADIMQVRWENSIKGASIFDERMLDLQKSFATALLTHVNPYTGRRYVDEPGLAVQEITNENSLFYLHNQKLMLPSYVADLTRRWNAWLKDQYGDRKGLAKAWSRGGETALTSDEDPDRGTVILPLKYLHSDLRDAPFVGEKSPARCSDMVRFLYELETAYYQKMIAHLRSLGLKCPITGTNQDFCDASNRANALCDFTSRNNYWCHPDVDAKPFQRFSNLAVVNSDIVTRSNPVAEVASSTVVGKPMVVPEFNFPFPNEFRAEALPLMAAYGRLQDWDGLLYFAYDPDRPALSNFGNQSDPVRWGQVPMAALLFLRGDISVARNTIHIGVSLADTFANRRPRASDACSPYRVLPYISRLRNAYFDDAYQGDADVVISSGHTSSGNYSAARRAIVLADWPSPTGAALIFDRGFSARLTVPGLITAPLTPPVVTDRGSFDTEISPASLPAGASAILEGGKVVGYMDDRRVIFPCASALGAKDPAWLHRLYLQAASRWGLPSAAPPDEAGRVFRSDTGELVLDRVRGVFTAVAPNVRIATGFLGNAGPVDLGGVRVQCATNFASISLISLDGKPVERSARLLLTAVSRAENTGQAFLNNRSAIPQFGRPPVIVEPVACQVTVPGASNLTATPLDSRGQKVSIGPLAINSAAGGQTIDVGSAHSPWILLERGQ
jgi:hypothetical protein